MLLGLAGKTGAGKNFVAAILVQRGWKDLDLDLVAHRALEELTDSIAEAFGSDILDDSGIVDRRELGRQVFSDPSKLSVLEQITYPWIEEESRRWILEHKGDNLILHAINLHKTGLVHDMDGIIWVHAPRRIRRRRIMERDGRTWAELKGRFNSQNALNPKIFPPDAEIYSVRNSGNRRSLDRRLDRILNRLQRVEPGGKT